MYHHLRYALRKLRREWSFSLMAVLTLALGIGAASGLFSVMHHLLWAELPYEDPEQLVYVWAVNAQGTAMTGIADLPNTAYDYSNYRDNAKSLSRVVLLNSATRVLRYRDDQVERLAGAEVSGQFFELLGVKAYRGHFFTEAEDLPGKGDVVVLSYRTWQRRFGGSDEILGQRITLNNMPYTVIGVAGPAMQFPSGNDVPTPYGFGTKTDFWMPLC